jgi:hypothetical protein
MNVDANENENEKKKRSRDPRARWDETFVVVVVDLPSKTAVRPLLGLIR